MNKYSRNLFVTQTAASSIRIIKLTELRWMEVVRCFLLTHLSLFLLSSFTQVNGPLAHERTINPDILVRISDANPHNLIVLLLRGFNTTSLDL